MFDSIKDKVVEKSRELKSKFDTGVSEAVSRRQTEKPRYNTSSAEDEPRVEQCTQRNIDQVYGAEFMQLQGENYKRILGKTRELINSGSEVEEEFSRSREYLMQQMKAEYVVSKASESIGKLRVDVMNIRTFLQDLSEKLKVLEDKTQDRLEQQIARDTADFSANHQFKVEILEQQRFKAQEQRRIQLLESRRQKLSDAFQTDLAAFRSAGGVVPRTGESQASLENIEFQVNTEDDSLNEFYSDQSFASDVKHE